MSSEQIAGKMIEFDAEGYMSDASVWDETIAAELAKREGIEQLTERHWMIINFMRKVFQEKGEAPSIRKLNKESGVDTKELYELFPKGPAKKAARIAGLPKPKGCI
ncbi:MAG TPA: TusE/DsrC/DsvC family sulfur relay protein [Ignavibacteria bacterium]|nr:TusE/DsrC/DsvC family sulfur relay protein [Ignavibacteria bacterium]